MMAISEAARILETGSATMREALARQAGAPPEALYYLVGDASPRVRAAVAANPATPGQSYAALCRDEEREVRAALAGRLARLAPGLPAPQHDRLAQMAWGALAQLASDAAAEIRAIIAEAVKALPEAPRSLILQLAADRDARVCEPVIRLSPLLTEEDLLTLVAAPPVAEILTAIARRPAISEAVADALVDTGDFAAISALLDNRTAAIRESTLDALVVQAAERTAWQPALVQRPALPPRAAVALAGFVADRLLTPLAERTDLPARTLAEIRAAVAQRLAGAARPGETAADATSRAEILHRAGALTGSVMLRAAQAGERDFIIAALATVSGMPRSAIEQAVTTRCAKALAGLCRQGGLTPETAGTVIGLLAPALPGDETQAVPAMVEDGELRWRIDALSRAAAQP